MAVASRLNPRYTAEVDILVTPMIGNAYSSTSGNHLVDLETESHLPSSDAVLRRVAADGESAPSEQVIRRRLSVHVVPNAQVIVIDYAAGDAGRGARDGPADRRRDAQGEVRDRRGRRSVPRGDRDREAHRPCARSSRRPMPLPPGWTLLSQRAVALNGELREAATGALASPGQVIDTVNRGDGHLAKLRLGVVGGFVLLGALLGLWVGRPARGRND